MESGQRKTSLIQGLVSRAGGHEGWDVAISGQPFQVQVQRRRDGSVLGVSQEEGGDQRGCCCVSIWEGAEVRPGER